MEYEYEVVEVDGGDGNGEFDEFIVVRQRDEEEEVIESEVARIVIMPLSIIPHSFNCSEFGKIFPA
jgi:hypothetical protein